MRFEDLPSNQRSLAPHHHIDTGFLNRRLCFSTFDPWLQEQFSRYRMTGNDHMTALSNDHTLVTLVLAACGAAKVPSLGEVLAGGNGRRLFCSTERVGPTPDIYAADHVRSRLVPSFPCEQGVFLEYHTQHIVADTARMRLHKGSLLSIVAGIDSVSDREIVARPLIIGDPTYQHQFNKDMEVDLFFHGWTWYEVFAGDISEFSRCKEATPPGADKWSGTMRSLSEQEVKRRLCAILGDLPKLDWAGEQDDHFAASLHLGAQQVTAAFLLKGPAQFREMTPDFLGARADQIYRLACTPAQMLVVQHCHHISEAVRATLRAFAVTPHNPRRYCLIDGKETYRILKAYGQINAG